MAVPVSWPSGVPQTLLRDGYTREPQDVVQRMKMDAGPPLRRLMDGAAAQRVKGVLSLSSAEAALFEAWQAGPLDRGANRFDWVISDNAQAVTARLAAQPRLQRTPTRWRYALDIACDAVPASLPALAALAALEDDGPAGWPGSVPFRAQRPAYGRAAEDGVLRSPDGQLQRQSLMSRADGHVVDVVLTLTPSELAAFEAWFQADAAFGARDVNFPDVDGGTVRGHFHEIYRIAPAGQTPRWAVSFKLYLEIVQ